MIVLKTSFIYIPRLWSYFITHNTIQRYTNQGKLFLMPAANMNKYWNVLQKKKKKNLNSHTLTFFLSRSLSLFLSLMVTRGLQSSVYIHKSYQQQNAIDANHSTLKRNHTAPLTITTNTTAIKRDIEPKSMIWFVFVVLVVLFCFVLVGVRFGWHGGGVYDQNRNGNNK